VTNGSQPAGEPQPAFQPCRCLGIGEGPRCDPESPLACLPSPRLPAGSRTVSAPGRARSVREHRPPACQRTGRCRSLCPRHPRPPRTHAIPGLCRAPGRRVSGFPTDPHIGSSRHHASTDRARLDRRSERSLRHQLPCRTKLLWLRRAPRSMLGLHEGASLSGRHPNGISATSTTHGCLTSIPREFPTSMLALAPDLSSLITNLELASTAQNASDWSRGSAAHRPGPGLAHAHGPTGWRP